MWIVYMLCISSCFAGLASAWGRVNPIFQPDLQALLVGKQTAQEQDGRRKPRHGDHKRHLSSKREVGKLVEKAEVLHKRAKEGSRMHTAFCSRQTGLRSGTAVRLAKSKLPPGHGIISLT